MNDEKKNLWDVRIGVFAPILTAISIVVGVITFSVAERNRVELEQSLILCRSEIAFRRELWLHRVTTYTSLAEAVGAIAASEDAGKIDTEAVKSFLRQYWGVMILAEDPKVEMHMRMLKTEVEHFQTGWSPPFALRRKSYELGIVLRESIHSREEAAPISKVDCGSDGMPM